MTAQTDESFRASVGGTHRTGRKEKKTDGQRVEDRRSERKSPSVYRCPITKQNYRKYTLKRGYGRRGVQWCVHVKRKDSAESEKTVKKGQSVQPLQQQAKEKEGENSEQNPRGRD